MAEAAKMQFYDVKDWKRKQQNRKADLPLSDRALSMREVTEKTGMSKSTIYRWIRAGEFPNGKRFGKCSVRWLESAIDAWMQSQEGLENGQ